jgi:hypothetical protein
MRWRQYDVRVRQGHQPRFTRYYCERCGADKRLGGRKWELLCCAEDELGEVDISRLPF